MKRSGLFLASLAAAALFAASCSPIVNQRGYLPNPEVDDTIVVGTDTKATVQQRLGSPSTFATFGGDTWYYISSVEERFAFFAPETTSRKIMAVSFDKDTKVADINRYTLKDGNIVAFDSRITPTRGREMTFLQQLFNASPGVPIGNNQTPGGGQGPPQ